MSDHSTAPLDSSSSLPDSGTPDTPRRNFVVQFLAGALGALAGLVPAVTGGLFFLDPILRKNKAPAAPAEGADAGGVVKKDGFIRLSVTLDALPADGTPMQVKVFDDIINVWNKIPNQPVGSVWLRQIENQVLAFNTVCPHLGCAVEHRAAEGDFYCPCHLSAFGLDGAKKNPIPPRGMDALETRLEGREIWLKFENFRAATPEKVPV